MIFHLLLVLLVGTPVILEGQAPAPFGLLPTQVSPDSVRVEILKIGMTSTMDSVHATAGHPIETGWKATVQGTVSDREYQVFVLVHPLLGGFVDGSELYIQAQQDGNLANHLSFWNGTERQG